MAFAAVIGIEPLQSEAEKRQRIRALGVLDQLLGQRRLDTELSAGFGHAVGRPLDDALEFRGQNRR